MVVRPGSTGEDRQRCGRGGLGDHPDAAVDDGVLSEPLGGEAGVVPRRPARPSSGRNGDQRPRAAVLGLGRGDAPPAEGPSPVEHGLSPRSRAGRFPDTRRTLLRVMAGVCGPSARWRISTDCFSQGLAFAARLPVSRAYSSSSTPRSAFHSGASKSSASSGSFSAVSDTVCPRTDTPAWCTVSALPETRGCQLASGRPSWMRR